MSDDNRGGGDPRPPKFSFKNNRFALFFLVALLVMFVVLLFSDNRQPGTEIDYSEFLRYLQDNRIEEVMIIDGSEIQGRVRRPSGDVFLFRTSIPYVDTDLVEELEEKGVRFSGAQRPVSPFRVILEFLPWIIGFFLIWFMFRQLQGTGNRAFSFGKSKAKKYVDTGEKITFSDVAGQKEAKYELQEVVEFLKHPEKFAKMGAKIPRGVLLVGMPGTGKTLLAKASAGEAGVPFFHMSGSDFVEMFVGVGASRVRDLFEQGRKNAPCILFIDELDAVGRTRGAGYGGGHDEREQTLNQMLVEMDGFDTTDKVIILAATNRPDVLDPALLRPGRFDRQIVVDMPDINEREAILRIHATKVPIASSVDLRRVAKATPGLAGADLANLVNEAALYAARGNKPLVDMDDFEEARDKVLMGVARKSRVLSNEEKRMTAFHESGHAILHYHLQHADPLHKVTIVPRGRALGLAMSLPEKDSYSRGRGWLMARIQIAYGGYIAEKMFFGETSTGTQNDLQQATDIARKMVVDWGMSDVGPIAFGQEDEPIFLGKEIARHKDYSEDTAQRIDGAVSEILLKCYEDTQRILEENRGQIETLAEALILRETLNDADIRDLFGLPAAKVDDENSA